MIDSGVFAMDTIFNDVCVLVTAAFALTLVPGFRQPERSLLSRRDHSPTEIRRLGIQAAILASARLVKPGGILAFHEVDDADDFAASPEVPSGSRRMSGS
jgi:hypothetical protein